MPDELLAQIRRHGAVPHHVAIIMDGSGRWARKRRLPRPFGHRAGMNAVHEVVEGAIEAGVEVLTLFAFSNENWQRPATEIDALMRLLEEYIGREEDELKKQGVAVHVLGERTRLGPGRARRSSGSRETPAAASGSRSTSASPTPPGRSSRARRGCSPRKWSAAPSGSRTSMKKRCGKSSTPRRGATPIS